VSDVHADLHVHTDVSDGTLRLETLPAAAARAGVEWVAVTDHDRVHPGLDAPVTALDGVRVVRGVELRVETDEGRLDLLGYAVDPTPALTALLADLQRDRVERAREMVARCEARLGVELDVDLRPGVGRPHVARAVDAHPDVECDYAGAFEHLIGDDGPCYVARDVPEFARGAACLDASCALVGLAHPLRYDDPEAALAYASELDAVERHYPYDPPADPAPVDRAIEEHDLVATGGSDAHDEELGRAGLDRAAFARVARRLQLD
jgi:hypothetical protein